MIEWIDDSLLITVENGYDLMAALDALQSYVIEDLTGDPQHMKYAHILGEAMDRLSELGIELPA